MSDTESFRFRITKQILPRTRLALGLTHNVDDARHCLSHTGLAGILGVAELLCYVQGR